MKDTLKKFLSARGDILSDDRSNQLIIRDIPSVIPTIDNLIRQLDRKSQQVEIEARVVSASRSFAQDIGTELGFAGIHHRRPLALQRHAGSRRQRRDHGHRHSGLAGYASSTGQRLPATELPAVFR